MTPEVQSTQPTDELLSTVIPETSRELTETQKEHVTEILESADPGIEVNEVVRLDNGTIELWLTDKGQRGSIMFNDSFEVGYMYANDGILCVNHSYCGTNYELFVTPRGGDA